MTAPHAAPSRAQTHTPFPSPQHTQDPAGWPGGHRKVDTPDPIPNSAVKHLSAHGTVAQATGESVAAGPPSRIQHTPRGEFSPVSPTTNAGWSSPVARQAHNLKVTGSNPVPASIPSLTYNPSHTHTWGRGLWQLGPWRQYADRHHRALSAGRGCEESLRGPPNRRRGGMPVP